MQMQKQKIYIERDVLIAPLLDSKILCMCVFVSVCACVCMILGMIVFLSVCACLCVHEERRGAEKRKQIRPFLKGF